jgi:uncharacterized protein (TIGR02001 family)
MVSVFPRFAAASGTICLLNWCLVASALCQDAGKPKAKADNNFETKIPDLVLTVAAQAMTDYNYRGITESAHRPSIYGSFDAQLGWFYVSAEAYSVKLPTSPRAEVIVGAGIRPKIGVFDFDIVLYDFLYPGELATPGFPASTDYWELNGRMSHKLNPSVTLGTELAYSASYSNSGAWATYLAGRAKIDLPSTMLPKDGCRRMSAGHFRATSRGSGSAASRKVPAAMRCRATGISGSRSITAYSVSI